MKNNDEMDRDSVLESVAGELETMSGQLTEINEGQINKATVEDVKEAKEDVKKSFKETLKEFFEMLGKQLSEPWSILNNMQNRMEENTLSNRQAVEAAEEHLCEKFDEMENRLTEKLDAFTAKPPVREVIHHVSKTAWQWYGTIALSILSFVGWITTSLWQEARIEQCRQSDIKYHFIQMYGGVNSEYLDSIESWFQRPEMVKKIERNVREYEKRVQETARTLQQKERLEQKLNELNSSSED